MTSADRAAPASAFTRRQVLRAGGAVALGAGLTHLLAACGVDGSALGSGGGGANTSTEGSAGTLLRSRIALPTPFRATLPIPPVLVPRVTDDADVYVIEQRAAPAQILDGPTTQVWGYDGVFPGPTIVARRGRRTVVTHRNELPVPTVVHLHGGRTAPEHDGFPTDLVLPVAGHDHVAMPHHAGDVSEGSRDYVYDNDQPAATLWYHDHRMDFTGPQVYRGLAGFHLIHDDAEDALGLPTGDRDLPLMIADRAFDEEGAFLYPSVDPSLTGTPGVEADYMSGVLGDCILVNGAAWPVHRVARARHRLRLLNASNARRYRLRFDDGTPLVQIGSDLGLLERPVRHTSIDIAQAERFDVVVDFSDHPIGSEVTLVNGLGRGGTADVMRFVVDRDERDDSRLPDELVPVERLDAADVVMERQFVFRRGGASAHGMELWTVDGEPWSPDAIVAQPRFGTVERWTIRAQNVEHPFHIHLAPFQVVDRDGNDRGPFDGGWKDTVNLDNGGRADLLIRFDGHRGRYVFHCHNLEHEDMMMMANFEVV